MSFIGLRTLLYSAHCNILNLLLESSTLSGAIDMERQRKRPCGPPRVGRCLPLPDLYQGGHFLFHVTGGRERKSCDEIRRECAYDGICYSPERRHYTTHLLGLAWIPALGLRCCVRG